MLDALNITEEEARGLSELAAQDLASAKEFAARARVVDDPKLACELARTGQRYGRAYRQTLALKIRLQREIVRAAAEIPPTPPPAPIHVARDTRRIRARMDALRGPLQRVVWSEYEWTEAPEHEDDDFAGQAFDRLEALLDRFSRDNTFGLQRLDEHSFGELPLDDHVVALARDLALDEVAAAGWRDLPAPPDTAFIDWPEDEGDDEDDWEGSG